jgi:hypothetical protein
MNNYIAEIDVRHGEHTTTRKHLIEASSEDEAILRTYAAQAEESGDGLEDEENDGGFYSNSREFHFSGVVVKAIPAEHAAILKLYI